ncbi:hypothetical protein CRUP_024866 [Coryphaenoides rupestris]|nr:hypothetical protein CRUP_024866 [Coryphaenoides rupestris]
MCQALHSSHHKHVVEQIEGQMSTSLRPLSTSPSLYGPRSRSRSAPRHRPRTTFRGANTNSVRLSGYTVQESAYRPV